MVLSIECAPGAAGQPQGRAQTDDMTRRVCTVKVVSLLQQIYAEALAVMGGLPVSDTDKDITGCAFLTGRHLSQASRFANGRNIQIILIKQYTKYSNPNNVTYQQI